MTPNSYRLCSASLVIACAASMVLGAGEAKAAQESAELSPTSITVGEAAELRIPLRTSGAAATTPSVAGLDIEPAGQSSEMSSVNGLVTQKAWALYRVIPQAEGVYSIPVGAQILTLTVSLAGAGTGAGQRSASNATQSPDPATDGPLAFLRATVAHRKVYVGQAIPITLKAYFRAGTQVTLSAPPSLTDPAFTVSDLSAEPRQGTEVVKGREYGVATWTALLSASMPGTFSSEVTLPIVARYQEASRMPASDLDDLFADDPTASSMIKSMLGQSFSGFGSAFSNPFGPMRERELTLHSPPQPLEVLPVPTAGRPASFSGAVGHFDLRSSISSSTGTAFEPLSLTVSVVGQGNFDRVTPPSLSASLGSTADWKAYPGTESFVPKTAGSGMTGTKSLVQPIVPERAGEVILPPFSFSFFDPDRAAYVTRATAPVHVQVAEAAAGAAGASAALASAGDATLNQVAAAADLRGNHPERGTVGALTPERSWAFLALLVLPWLALAGVLVLARRRRASSAERELRARLTATRREMHRAAETADPFAFFGLARSVVTDELAEVWRVPTDQITPAEIYGRLGESGRPLASALVTAEQLIYAGGTAAGEDLPAYERRLSETLDHLEVAS